MSHLKTLKTRDGGVTVTGQPDTSGSNSPVRLSVSDAIAQANAATTIEELDQLAADETRTKVLAAITKRRDELTGGTTDENQP